MPIWKIERVADPDDPRWLDRPVFEEVVVRAGTAAEARRVAAKSGLEPPREETGNETLGDQSAFEDEKLYHVAFAQEPSDAPAGEKGAIVSVRKLGEPSNA